MDEKHKYQVDFIIKYVDAFKKFSYALVTGGLPGLYKAYIRRNMNGKPAAPVEFWDLRE